MKYRRAIPAICLSALTAGFPLITTISYASSKPYYCKHPPARGLRPNQQQICDSDQEAKNNDQKPPDEVTYPLEKYKYIFSEVPNQAAGPGQQFPFSIESKDGSILRIVYFENRKPTKQIISNQIVSWTSGATTTGTDSRALAGAAVGLITGLIFLPNLLLVPWSLMKSQYNITPYQLIYVNEYGDDSSFMFYGSGNKASINALFKDLTGLDSGIRRSNTEIRQSRLDGLNKSELKLIELKMPITVGDTRKPWCSYLDLSGTSQDVNAYKKQLSIINRVRENLELPPYEETINSASSDGWSNHLEANQGLKAWAEANPTMAEKAKSCN